MEPAIAPHPGLVGGRGRRIVVGVDGSRDSVAALRAGEWAAAIRGGTLVAVTAWTASRPVLRTPERTEELRRIARDVQHAAVEDAFSGRCLVPVDLVLRQGRPAPVLVDEARDADLLVVGSRGHGGFAGLLLGSVGMACASHAPCPVLVMHDGDVPAASRAPLPDGTVVVGVGGRPDPSRVFRVAAEAASEMGASLDVVAALDDAQLAGGGTDALHRELRAAAQQAVAEATAAAFADGRPAGVRELVRSGGAAHVLVEESAHADLVVVGRSGASALTGVLLGSVALPVAQHAACPVLVVPAAPVRAAEGSIGWQPAAVA